MERNEQMDFYKGMLMWGVLWGHCITVLLLGTNNDIGIHVILRTYDMPMFMLISGYYLRYGNVHKKKTIGTLLRDKITTILFPLVLWSLISTRGVTIFNYYFLWAILLSVVLIIIVHLIFRESVWEYIALGIISVGLNFVPFDFFNCSYLFPFFVIGYVLNTNSLLFKRINEGGNFVIWTLWILFVALLCFWKKDFTVWKTGTFLTTMDTRMIFIFIFRFVIGIVGCLAMISVFNMLYLFFSSQNNICKKFILQCGKETLAIYILQHIVLFSICERLVHALYNLLGYNLFATNKLLTGYIIAPALSLTLIALFLLILRFLKRNQYTRFIFGFKINSNYGISNRTQ